MNLYLKGVKNGLPIGLGYLSVSFAFGVAAVHAGLPLWAAVAISMTNLTSAGQLAGLGVITAAGGMLEMALTQLIINLRYALMSVSLSQKLDDSVKTPQRLAIAFGNTDEIFAMAIDYPEKVKAPYFYGLMTLPYIGWAGGTLLGAVADQILPASVLSALGVAIYGMLVAIVVPASKKSKTVALVAIISVALSSGFKWIPVLNRVSGGFAVILCGIIAATVGALVRPVEEEV